MNTKKRFAKIIFRCLIFVFAMITVTYSWFTFNSKYIGPSMRYNQNLVISSNEYTIKTYVGTQVESEDNDIFTYSDTPILQGENFSKLIYPGKKVAFKTTITNNDPDNLVCLSLYLDNIIYDSVLKNYVFYGVSSPYSIHRNYANKSIEYTEEKMDMLSGPIIADHVTVQVGETVSVYWYVYLDSELSNIGKNTSINLNDMKILIG